MRKECKIQSTSDSERKIAGLVLAICNMITTGKPSNDLTIPQFHSELQAAADSLDVPLGRMIDWAGSVMLDPSVTLTAEEMKAVPTRNKAKDFDLHGYQITTAGWCARRLGSVEALGCGVGKTATSIAAAIAGKRLGTFKGNRVYIICPLNAMATWRKAVPDLEAEFAEVQIVSVDSLHHYKGLTVADGGALIIDECHKTKHEATGRTKEAYEVRRCFEWATCLTGSLLHTGPEGLMTILDLACPGLSRFIDKWAFGEAFSCIATKPVQMGGRRRNKHSLVIPGDEPRPFLARYLERAARSLSLTSPEVAAVVQVPGQTATTVDTWEKPDWVIKLFAECRENIEAAAKAPAGTVIPGINEALWAPDVPWQTLMGALAVCIMEETREEILEVANEIENSAVTSIENAVKSIQTKLDDPFFREGDLEWLGRRKPLAALIKNPGLPTFPKVLHAACRVGRYDQVIVKTTEIVGELKNVTWRFKYGPGHDRKNPGIGPKCQFVLDWLRDNEKEPLVAGAAGRGSVSVIAKALEEQGISHRIIRGGVSSKHREQFVDEFNNGDVRVMLVQQVAGSESIDLIRAATSMLVDHDWSANTYEQYLARTNRQGQKRECIHYDLSFNGVQTESIGRLIRGRDFDAQTRALLEKECNMNNVLSSLLRE
jgi:hypothetical protein